jgi:hypothetical protein
MVLVVVESHCSELFIDYKILNVQKFLKLLFFFIRKNIEGKLFLIMNLKLFYLAQGLIT